MKNKFGPPEKQKDPYQIYEGKEVRVIGKSGSSLGILQEINPRDNNYSLMPSLISVNLPNEYGNWIDNVYINEEDPTKVRKSDIDKIEPLPEGYMYELAKRIRYHSDKGHEEIPIKEKLSLRDRLIGAVNILRGKGF
jgi:hypothetical protein